MMNGLLSIALLLTSFSAFAQAKRNYDCNLRVSYGDTYRIDQNFKALDDSSNPHDNQVFYSDDERTQVIVVVDSTGIILNWSENGLMIANGFFTLGGASNDARTVILYNPSDPDDQVSLTCDPSPSP